MSGDCLFCAIIAGAIPSRQIYADDSAIAFLDIQPWHRGHTLVVPRRHVASIIDDTGFLKQGKHSVGVQRQYTGSAGKVANCQVGVSLSLATRSDHLPVDFEPYLPTTWTVDPARRREAAGRSGSAGGSRGARGRRGGTGTI